MKGIITVFAAIFVFQLFVSAQTLDDKLKEIDAYANTVTDTWRSSGAGMAIAIVKDDKVVFQKGYGVKRIEADLTSLNYLTNDTPEQAYIQLFNAVKSTETRAIAAAMTLKSLEFGKMAASRQGQPWEKVLENGFTATTFSDTLPAIRDARITDGFAAVEVYNARESKWEDLPFAFENGGWRLAIGEIFAGTYKSPGKSLAAIEAEKHPMPQSTPAPPDLRAMKKSHVKMDQREKVTKIN